MLVSLTQIFRLRLRITVYLPLCSSSGVTPTSSLPQGMTSWHCGKCANQINSDGQRVAKIASLIIKKQDDVISVIDASRTAAQQTPRAGSVCLCDVVGGVNGLIKADSHIACRAHALPLPCRPAKGLECVFPILFTQCGRV